MRMSQLLGSRFKERPAEAAMDSHAFLLRGGYMRPVDHGVFALLPAGCRVMDRIERAVCGAMAETGGQRVGLPWPCEASGMERASLWARLAQRETGTYAQLPVTLFALGEVERAGIPIRGGLLQSQVFRLFEACTAGLEGGAFNAAKAALRSAALRALSICGFEAAVAAAAGPAREVLFVPCEGGSEALLDCSACGQHALQPWARASAAAFPSPPLPLEPVLTPGTKSIADLSAFLGIEPRQTAKAVLFERDAEGRLTMALVRGDLEVSEEKLSALLGVALEPATDARIRAAGAEPGFASPAGLPLDALRIIADPSLRHSNNLVAGANRPDYHVRNFNLERDAPSAEVQDIALAEAGQPCVCGAGVLSVQMGFETGCLLDAPEAACAGLTVDDAQGHAAPLHLAVCRIGLGRLLALAVEGHHDAYGPLWPAAIAPWDVQVLALPGVGVAEASERIVADLERAGRSVLFDDRGLRPGVQFAEADLLGIPRRIVVGEKHLADGRVEYKRRGQRDGAVVSIAGLPDSLD